ncbi:hypothetical protein E2C01_018085 [Portunus trituberculatus]|uniref:Uncharacterized protein n=1 Tax=Portunus trituberculatus TaxID=210409 RepID=A0A5B7DU53_PORTR|nr:hypothetical protein [Portunus trituberculatus]
MILECPLVPLSPSYVSDTRYYLSFFSIRFTNLYIMLVPFPSIFLHRKDT